MLHSYKFIYEGMAYITFHGVISTDYPDLENQARATYSNAISWKELNAQDNAQLKMTLNQVVESKNVATIPLLIDPVVSLDGNSFNVTGRYNGKEIKIVGDCLWEDGKLVWPEGENVLAPAVKQEATKPEPVVEAEPEVVSEHEPQVESAKSETEVKLVSQEEKELLNPEVDFHRLPIGFIYGKSAPNPGSGASFGIGFMQGAERTAAGQAKVFGSTDEHFVWCEEYAKTHKPTWKTTNEESHDKEEPKIDTTVESEQNDVFDDIFGDEEESPIGTAPQEVSYTTDTEYIERKSPEPVQEPITPKKSKAPVTDTVKAWENLLAEKRDIDDDSKDFVPDAPVKEQLRSAVSTKRSSANIELPDFLSDVPREFLGNINAFTTAEVDKEMLVANGISYCIQNGWANLGNWYCIDVVSNTSRFFYNEVDGICEEVTFVMCKEMLRQIEG